LKTKGIVDLYLLDTNIVSYAMKGSPEAELYDDIFSSGEPLFISVQTEAELLYGARWKKWGEARLSELRDVIDLYRVLPIDRKMVPAWAAIVSKSRHEGRELETKDAWIAATAIRYKRLQELKRWAHRRASTASMMVRALRSQSKPRANCRALRLIVA
jgi:predicted nucleic acid-binding protein